MRILVLDPQPVVREGLKAQLETFPGLLVVETCADARTALTVSSRLTPDVVVMDLDLERGDGVGVIRDLRRRLPRGALVVFAARTCWRAIGWARLAGAAGFVLKTDPLATLAEAMYATARGETYFSPSLPSALRQTVEEAPDVLEALSEREREVFYLVVLGLTNRRIARQLFISPKTVDSHRGRILGKLGCRSAVELVRFAFVNGLATDHVRTQASEESTVPRSELILQ